MGSANRGKIAQGSARNRGGFEKRTVASERIRSAQPPLPPLIGSSELFTGLMDTVESVARRHCCVMITGETGTGKEMVARKIHHSSLRSDRSFIPVDCTTLTGQLFESQLFGHVKGAFTGAVSDTMGFFRAGDGGTIFLDEISEIPLDLQAKLLRVLQEGTVTPVGSTQSYQINVRILCAANRDLKEMIAKNEFRTDLYYRLNVVNLEIPPLRQRAEDILPLAHHFLAGQASFYNEPAKTLSAEAEQFLLRYHWPGNVRQVANAMERAFVLSMGEVIEPSVLPKEILTAAYTASPESPLPTLNDAKSKLIADALRVTGGRKVAAARILGIDRRRLNRLMEKLNITAPKSGQ
ncbi:MAG: sigma-54 interaction domain-containing protein [Planctomycetota bacterium]